MSFRNLLAMIWPLVLILVITISGWFLLSNLALQARRQESTTAVKGPIPADYTKAKDWATDLLGLAGTFAGFLGIAAVSLRSGLTSADRAQIVEGGIIGILAGATLLRVGGWSVPIALAALVTGLAVVRVVCSPRE
jgi:hypothetical protein